MIPAAIVNPSGESLAFDFTRGDPEKREVVVLGHGLTSDKDRPWSTGLSNALSRQGVASLRFAFSGNGDSEGRFLDSCITKEIADLGAVLDALPDWEVSYLGHSMGAAVGLLRAGMDDRIRALVSLSAVTHTAEFLRRMFGDLRHGDPMLDKAHCPYGPVLESDLLAWESLAGRASEIRVPWLVLHGTKDDVVPVQHSLDLYTAEPARSSLVLLEDVEHSFEGDALERMIQIVVAWLGRHGRNRFTEEAKAST